MTRGVIAGVLIAALDGAGEGGDGLNELLALLLDELGGLDADGDAGGDGVGVVKFVLGERLVEEAAVEVQDADAIARRAQQAQMTEAMAPWRMLRASTRLSSALTSSQRIDSPMLKQRCTSVLLKGRTGALVLRVGDAWP